MKTLAITCLALAIAASALATPPLRLLKASYFGTEANDNFEGAAVGPDGSLYLVGNAGVPNGRPVRGLKPVRVGRATTEPRCGCGFVMKLSPDAAKVLAYAEFGKGILHATAIAVTDKGVYVGGYASDGLEPLLKGREGLISQYPLRTEQQLIADGKMMEANGFPPGRRDSIGNRPWLGRLGAPCVLKLSSDLKALESGTYLEGWQQVYDKYRVCGHRRKGLKGAFREHFWQPVNICPLKSGDVVVSHDGGYFRMLTDQDRKQALELEEGKRARFLQRLCFYDTADHVSRLSADLAQRAWKTDIHTPPTVTEVANEVKAGWFVPHYGNPRVHRMRADRDGNLWVCGWSATATSNEPWWSPFLLRLDPETGKPTRRLYEYDPMSGGGNRMGGTVADTALLSVAVEDDGDLLTCLISDGGNSWIGRGPRGHEGEKMKGRVIGPGHHYSPAHFWGHAQRVDGKTFDGLGGAKTGPWAWTIDTAGLPDDHFLALGRWNHRLPWTEDAWWTHEDAEQPNPNAFLRVVGPDYNTVFWTAIPGMRPYEVMPIGDDRYIITGFADNGAAPMKNSVVKEAPGGEDAYFAIVQWREPLPFELVTASFFGTVEDDDIQGGCAGTDGAVYIAGNTRAAPDKQPSDGLVQLGPNVAEPRCGRGFVARLSPDGDKVLDYALFGNGILSLTTVKANEHGVYVAGYASDGLEPLLKDVPGAIKEYPLREEVALLQSGKWGEAVGASPDKDPIPEDRRRQLGRYGAPFVLRLSPDLKTLQCGTYLEGWQQVWGKRRCISTKPVWRTWPEEWSWQPTLVEILASGDVVVCHDGGYFRLLTPEDRALAEKVGIPRLLKKLGFYDVCDHLSRLKPDLGERVYHQRIYTPTTDPEVARKIKYGWPYAHFSNPRTHRMCLDGDENLYLCGWSATETSREPWWAGYTWKMNAADGSLIKKILERDPMSGPNHRMHGAVADRGVGAVAVGKDSVYYNSYSDGGWSGVIHFSGSLFRLDRQTTEVVGSVRTGPCYWVTDMKTLPKNRVLAMGRCNYRGGWGEDAWQSAGADENPVAWLSIYDDKKQMQPLFTTAIRGVVPYALSELDDGRYIVVGKSLDLLHRVADRGEKTVSVTEEPNPGVTVVKNAMFDKHQGKSDGYFMIVETSH